MEEIKVLITQTEIDKRINEIAKQIEKDYEGKDILFLGVLKGSVPFLWELSKRIKNNVVFEFVEISSYENNENSGKLTLHKDIKDSICGKDVIIVEDIIDSGRTLSYLVDYLKQKNPNTIKIATLLSKPKKRVVDIKVDYMGFEIEDKFVLGFGLDDNQNLRNLPYIGYKE